MNLERRSLAVAAVSAAVVVACILTAVIVGELPDPLWVLLVPVGMLGGTLTCAFALALAFLGRHRR